MVERGVVPEDVHSVLVGAESCHAEPLDRWLLEGLDAGGSALGAELVCFPECYVPGYRALGAPVPPADPAWLEQAHATVAAAAARSRVAVVLGTERFVDGARPDGTLLVHQPHGRPGLLLADLDLDQATLLLAQRWRT